MYHFNQPYIIDSFVILSINILFNNAEEVRVNGSRNGPKIENHLIAIGQMTVNSRGNFSHLNFNVLQAFRFRKL